MKLLANRHGHGVLHFCAAHLYQFQVGISFHPERGGEFFQLARSTCHSAAEMRP